MSGSGQLDGFTKAIRSIQHRIYTSRKLIARRITVLLLFLYLAALVDVGSAILGDLRTGFWYDNIGHTLFPYPHTAGGLLPVITPVPPIEVFVYVAFVYQGIWIAWTALGIIYIVAPLFIWAYRTLRKPAAGAAQAQQEKEEKTGILTGMLVFLSILLSIGTFAITNNLHSYGFMPFLAAVGLSAVLVGILTQNC